MALGAKARQIVVAGLIALVMAIPIAPSATAQLRDEVREESIQFAPLLMQFVIQVRLQYYRAVSQSELLLAAMTGLYETANQTMPDSVRASLKAATDAELITVLTKAHADLGHNEAIAGRKAFLACAGSINRALDPHSCLIGVREFGALADEDQFGVGVAFANAPIPDADLPQDLRGRPLPRPRAGRSTEPAGLPDGLLVRMVIPGSPAQRAGLRPGDRVVAVDGRPCHHLAMSHYRDTFFPQESDRAPSTHTIEITRPGRTVNATKTIAAIRFWPESIVGVRRDHDGQWEYTFDTKDRIGYIRVGPIDRAAAADFQVAIESLRRRDAQALILDLRWCTGGYIDFVVEMARSFLPAHQVPARIVRRGNSLESIDVAINREPLTDMPILVLVGCETIGGGEMIAAALQDHKRAIVAGDRTAGKGSVQQAMRPNPLEMYFPEMKFKISTGMLQRPSKASLQRMPHSRINDDWGVRPDPGRWLPVSREVNQQLKEWWMLHALRPANDRSPLPIDDLETDPQLKAAIQMLKDIIK